MGSDLLLGTPRVIDQTEQLSTMSQKVTLDRGTLHTLLAIAGRQSISEIADRCGRDRLLKDLVMLLDLGLIRIDPPSVPKAPDGNPWITPKIAPNLPPERQLADGHRRDLGTGATRSAPGAANVPLTAESCPRLGILDDPASIYDRPSSHHRCFAGPEPAAVSTDEQLTLCLTGRYESCPHYGGAVASAEDPAHAELDTTRRTGYLNPPAEPPDVPRGASRSMTTEGFDGRSGGETSDRNSGSPSIDSARSAPAFESTHADSPTRAEATPSAREDAPTARQTVPGTRHEQQLQCSARSKPGRRYGSSVERRPHVLAAVVARLASRRLLALVFGGFATAACAAWLFYQLSTIEVGSPQQAVQARLASDIRGTEVPPSAGSVSPPVGAIPRQDPPAPTAVLVPATQSIPSPAPSGGIVSVASAGVEQPGTSSGVAASASQTPTIPTPSLRTVFAERFVTEDRRDWPNDPRGTAWVVDGAYRVSAREPGRFVAIGAPDVGPFRDVVVTATLRKVGGPTGGGYGLIVRDQGPGPRDGINQGGRYYVFEAGDEGTIGIWRRETDHWVDLQSWTPSEAVNRDGASNQLSVQAVDSRLSFQVNGVQVASLDDPVPGEGNVGIFVGGDLNEVAVDEFLVQLPE